MTQRLYSLATICLICISLLSCSKQENGVIRFGMSNMPANLNPLYATDAASSRIGRLLFQRLIDFDEAMKPIPGIADWEIVSPRQYRFTLNDRVRPFHNKTQLTARDVKASYDFILNEANASPHRASIKLIEKIETPDDRTIDFFLNRTDPLFPGYLVMGILPEELIKSKHAFERKPIGSGPVKFIEWPEDGKLIVERQSDKQKIEFLHVPNPTVRVLKLMRGEIDLVQNDLPPELINFLADEHKLNIIKTRGSNFAYLGFNLEDKELSNLAIRQAVSYAINRDEIIQYVFGNSARKANSLLPPDHWAGNPALKEIDYSPEKAIQILEPLGYNRNNPLLLSYKTSSDPFRIRLATIMQSQLAEVGIKMDIRSYDWGTFYGDIKNGRFQLFSLAWIGIKTPDIFRYVFHSSAIPPNGANRGRFSDVRMDKAIESAESQTNLISQATYYQQVQKIALEELPYVPLWYENHVAITRNGVDNYTLSWDGNYDGLLNIHKTAAQ